MAIKWRRNIAENFNPMSRGHERYRQQTDRRQTDGRTTTFAKKEEKKHSIYLQHREKWRSLRVKTGIPDPWTSYPYPTRPVRHLPVPDPYPRVRVGYGYTRGYG